MPEAGLRIPVERYSLVSKGDVYCIVDVVDADTASVSLTPLPDHPLAVPVDTVRELVAAWRQSAELNPDTYEVREERIAL
jgi:hypothetical protein